MKLITGIILAVVAVVSIDATALDQAREKCGKNASAADKEILEFKDKLPTTKEQYLLVACVFKEIGFMDSNKRLVLGKADLLFDSENDKTQMKPLIAACVKIEGETQEDKVVQKFLDCLFKN